MTLEDALAASAAGLELETDRDGASVAWRRGSTTFATLDPDRGLAAFRLDPVLAEAACRTPDVHVSARGGEWVEFSPTVVDAHAIDRATAWFEAAWRRADG